MMKRQAKRRTRSKLKCGIPVYTNSVSSNHYILKKIVVPNDMANCFDKNGYSVKFTIIEHNIFPIPLDRRL